MKSGTATRKIPGGKMVRVETTFDKKVESVKITGDFFLHPEETLELIVKKITGSSLPLEQEKIILEIETILEQQEAQFIGANAREIVSILVEALQ
jgi:lipoate-protein ligase A